MLGPTNAVATPLDAIRLEYPNLEIEDDVREFISSLEAYTERSGGRVTGRLFKLFNPWSAPWSDWSYRDWAVARWQAFKSTITQEDCFFIARESDNRIIGLVYFWPRPDRTRWSTDGNFYCFVHPSARDLTNSKLIVYLMLRYLRENYGNRAIFYISNPNGPLPEAITSLGGIKVLNGFCDDQWFFDADKILEEYHDECSDRASLG